MPYATEADPYRTLVGSFLEDSSGREAVSWKEASVVAAHLAALASSRFAFVYGGTGMSDRSAPAKEGVLTRAEVEGEREGAALVLTVGNATLRLRLEGIALTYVPHPSDSADAGFVLCGRAADEATRAWEVKGRLGPDHLELAIGQEGGLLIGAARGIAIRHPFFASQLRKALDGGIYRPKDVERLKDEAEAKRLLKSVYAEHRTPRPNGPLTQDDISALGWAALQLGLQPTVELVREIHGKGSPSAIHPMLKNFYGSLVEQRLQPAPPAPVPEPLVRFWAELTAEVRLAGDEALRPAREALMRAQSELDAKTRALSEDRRRWDEEQRIAAAAGAERERHVASQQHRIEVLETDLATSRTTISGFELELAAARRDRQETQRALADMREDLARRVDAHDESQRRVAELDASLIRLRDALEHAERSEATTRTTSDLVHAQVGALRADMRASKEALASAQAECERWGDIAARHATDLQRTTLEAAIATAEITRLQPLEKTLAATTTELATLRGTLAAIEAERDRLAGLLQRQRGQRAASA